MGKKVECPNCGHSFYVHGYEEVENCYSCNSMFNPQVNMINENENRYVSR